MSTHTQPLTQDLVHSKWPVDVRVTASKCPRASEKPHTGKVTASTQWLVEMVDGLRLSGSSVVMLESLILPHNLEFSLSCPSEYQKLGKQVEQNGPEQIPLGCQRNGLSKSRAGICELP